MSNRRDRFELTKMGAKVREFSDGMAIKGGALKGAEVSKVRLLPKADHEPLEAAEPMPEEQT